MNSPPPKNTGNPEHPRVDAMFLFQRFARNAFTVRSSEGRGRPNSENLPALDNTSTCGRSDRQCRQAVELDSFGASIGDAISLALLAQCMP